ncbi:unnamed protein product [Kluyveromyces dobzhanskii CBS 2104]|uniref:WGS project CCBQ000000000 data, contig 00011 n=1 Tax=Kluyveromyces dobzhanskii CBS 2104 TaxID=1427455 RepID=A0A0A8L7B6_9SACH|nr:unnamed protein product [Kluyveromyces dobzhanskii CBS 2104]
MSQSQAQDRSIITQVVPEGQTAPGALLGQDGSYIDYEQYNDEDTLIHLNIQEKHYYITRTQLMSLPESLLLCLFPSGIFMDRDGQIITNLTSEDEVYIPNFSTDCFEYIMNVYNQAHTDVMNFPVNELFNRKASNLSTGGSNFFSFGSSNNSSASQESEILHEKPGIIVLREDLDYYCVPQVSIEYPSGATDMEKEVHLHNLMVQIKLAAGSHLLQQKSVFLGLKSSNRAKKPAKSLSTGSNPGAGAVKLGSAEQHLMDMLCSSGFEAESVWGNRFQEMDKTVISSLSLCRLANETTQEFRELVASAKARYDDDQKSVASSQTNDMASIVKTNSSPQLTPTPSRTDVKRKSRLSVFSENVRSRSRSRNRSASRQRANEPPTLYELVPKPEINTKLLLFWKKPARKCWWGQELIDLELDYPAKFENDTLTISADTNDVQRLQLPVRIHIRRVWTLELSIIGIQ